LSDLVIEGLDIGIWVEFSVNCAIIDNKISGLRSTHPIYAAVGIELGTGTDSCIIAGNIITSQYPAEGILLYTFFNPIQNNFIVFNDIEVSVSDPISGIVHDHAHAIGLIDGRALWGGKFYDEIMSNMIAVNDLRGNERTILQSTPGQALVYSTPGPANTVECNLGHDPYSEDCEDICEDMEEHLEDLGFDLDDDFDFDCDEFEEDEDDD
jgi:hypothetical protein